MKNRRFFAIVLLAALALLQARLAFAGCFAPERAAVQAVAGCCLDHASPDAAAHGLDQREAVCAPHCLESPNTASDLDTGLLVGSGFAVPFSPSLLRSSRYAPSSASLRLTGSEGAHPVHTRLVYVLQRLLI